LALFFDNLPTGDRQIPVGGWWSERLSQSIRADSTQSCLGHREPTTGATPWEGSRWRRRPCRQSAAVRRQGERDLPPSGGDVTPVNLG